MSIAIAVVWLWGKPAGLALQAGSFQLALCCGIREIIYSTRNLLHYRRLMSVLRQADLGIRGLGCACINAGPNRRRKPPNAFNHN